MKKRIISVLIAMALCMGVLPVTALAAETAGDPNAAKIVKKSLTLSGILGMNFYVDKNGEADLSGYTLETSIEGYGTQTVSTPTQQDGLYIFTAALTIKNLYRPVSVVLKKDGNTVQSGTFLFTDYVAQLKTLYPTDFKLKQLLDALSDYGTYATYYASPSGALTTSDAVEAVQPADLQDYKHTYVISKEGRALNAVVSLYLDSACDLCVKFDAAAFEGCVMTVDGVEIPRDALAASGNQLIWTASELLPQDWDSAYHIQVSRDGQELISMNYSVLSYVYAGMKRQQEGNEAFTGMLKSMYCYNRAANTGYLPANSNQICINYTDNGDGTVTATFSVNGEVCVAALELQLGLALENATYADCSILTDCIADTNYIDGVFIFSLYMPETDLTEPSDLFSITFTKGADPVGIDFTVIDSSVSDGTFMDVREVSITGTSYPG